ncbi:DUF3810 domain-containing protein [Acetobacterium wieringae]|uniref:DUF3810 domain-containing protein n=1 Tax=Acetobacterium wieringae TaxID=52694 RepID=A0ABY6HA01_9FIRM|nr:DUF3810 domain-containing protein [Acetobacterium wieringae]UYO61155.1 DUF3810 domain-containing protein [Acetobacterium wieringae]VUZ24442.1 Uncharacterised protein [Acetobacterium wieringae]
MKKFLSLRWLVILPGVVAYLLNQYAQYHPNWAEQYSRTAYPIVSNAVGFLPSLVKFSVSEWLAVAVLLFLPVYLGYYLHQVIISKGDRGMAVYRASLGIVAMASVIYFCFTLLGGLNYYRDSFLAYTPYHEETYSEEELVKLCQSLADEMGQTRERLDEDHDFRLRAPDDFYYYAQQSVLSIQLLAKQYPVLERSFYSTPKPVVMSKLMSRAGIMGIFIPFTLESDINADLPVSMIPATMTHELAHQCGFMYEDEANFISYLACRQQDDPMIRYSGLFQAFDYSISALAKVDAQKALAIISSLPEQVRQDMIERDQYWAKYEGTISKVSRNVNDAYLKANNQTDGVSSYHKMVNLLLAEQRYKWVNDYDPSPDIL